MTILKDNFPSEPGTYKGVGRFRLIEFKFDAEGALAVLEFTAANGDEAHHVSGIAAHEHTFSDLGIAVLADTLPAGPEKDYLRTVHKAIFALAEVHVSYSELFRPACPNPANDSATLGWLVKQIDAFRRAIAPLCLEPTGTRSLSEIVKIKGRDDVPELRARPLPGMNA